MITSLNSHQYGTACVDNAFYCFTTKCCIGQVCISLILSICVYMLQFYLSVAILNIEKCGGTSLTPEFSGERRLGVG